MSGGALPEFSIDSWAINLEPLKMKLSSLENKLRKLPIPIIGRIDNGCFILDVRTIQDREISVLVSLLADFFDTYSTGEGEGID